MIKKLSSLLDYLHKNNFYSEAELCDDMYKATHHSITASMLDKYEEVVPYNMLGSLTFEQYEEAKEVITQEFGNNELYTFESDLSIVSKNPKILHDLVLNNENLSIYEQVALNQNTSIDTLFLLRNYCAENPNFSELKKTLSEHPTLADFYEDLNKIYDDEVTPEELEEVYEIANNYKDSDIFINRWIKSILANPQTPLEILYENLNNEEYISSILQNPSCSTEMLTTIFENIIASPIFEESIKKTDYHPYHITALYYIAYNPNATEDMLDELFNISLRASKMIGARLRGYMLHNPRIPEQIKADILDAGVS